MWVQLDKLIGRQVERAGQFPDLLDDNVVAELCVRHSDHIID
jgi:hypothetical protein